MHSLVQGQQTGLEHQVADQMSQQGYGQNMFPYHLIPANLQQDIANALASGNNELAQAATQRFMQYAQVCLLHRLLRHYPSVFELQLACQSAHCSCQRALHAAGFGLATAAMPQSVCYCRIASVLPPEACKDQLPACPGLSQQARSAESVFCVVQAHNVGLQDGHDASGFSQGAGYPQQHLTPEQMMLAHGGRAILIAFCSAADSHPATPGTVIFSFRGQCCGRPHHQVVMPLTGSGLL